MIQSKTMNYVGEEIDVYKDLIRKLKKLAEKHSIQYALLWYIYLRKDVKFGELYKLYNYLSNNRVVRETTVRNQLKQLERKGLIRRYGDKYVALVDPRDVVDLFDRERSKVGRIGAAIRHLRIEQKNLKVSPGLAYYSRQVIEAAKELVRKGRRSVALDLLVHTLLPLRENEILWLWHGDLFVYYTSKTGAARFRAIKSEEISKLLRKLGFSEGIMIFHVLGHNEASRIIHKLFQRGPYSWPWARSVSYGLKQIGLLQEIDDLYKIQLKRMDNRIELTLWNLYTKELIASYSIDWSGKELPEPLKDRSYVVATVLGRQHVKQEIEVDSYFSKWSM